MFPRTQVQFLAYIVAYNCLKLEFQGIWCSLWLPQAPATHMVYTPFSFFLFIFLFFFLSFSNAFCQSPHITHSPHSHVPYVCPHMNIYLPPTACLQRASVLTADMGCTEGQGLRDTDDVSVLAGARRRHLLLMKRLLVQDEMQTNVSAH